MQPSFDKFTKKRPRKRTVDEIDLQRDFRESFSVRGAASSQQDDPDQYFLQKDGVHQQHAPLWINDAWKAWGLVLTCSLLSSTFCPLLLTLGEPVLYKLFWNSAIVFVVMLATRREVMTLAEMRGLLVPGYFFIGWTFCMVYSSHFNNLSQTLLFSNCPGMFLVVYRLLTKEEKVTATEKIGFSLGVLGIICVSTDESPLTYEGSVHDFNAIPYWERILNGNLVALLGSVFAAGFLISEKHGKTTDGQKSTFFAFLGMPTFLAASLLSGAPSGDDEHSLFSIFRPT